MKPPKFIYFDLGKVLVDFTVEQMCRQLSEAAQTTPEEIHRVLFSDGLELRYERGLLSTEEFYEEFCRQIGRRVDFPPLAQAAADIFTWKPESAALAVHLRQAGYRLGILSNTSPLHWEHCLHRYCVLRETFGVYALSYRVGHLKPAPEIYQAAAELAGCRPEEVFFVDDYLPNVEGARAAGLDAVQYTGPADLAAELRRRGCRFNY
ncbi:MAG TPA: HAD family phosphatase [Thermoguttaceae bacterium]|nr:HAD family phosphatase [Thermoguttaceae bacterium]HPP52116.1 HAD family phosphatase [Thermoguttaceae bacterium]